MFATWERQKMMLEAKKRLNLDVEMSQLADNKCIVYTRTVSRYGVLDRDS